MTNSKLIYGTALIGACAIICVAIVAQAQYNSYESDSELGKLVRGSGKMQQSQRNLNAAAHAAAAAAATRNLHSQPQQMQFAPTQHRRNFGPANQMSGYGPSMGASSSHGRGSNSDVGGDDDEGSNFGPANFGANFDGNSNNDNDGEGNSNNHANSNVDGPVTNLNQAASGYPNQNDYSNEAAAAGFNFDGNFGPSSADGSDFGPSEFGPSEGKRAKSASSPMGSRNFGSEEDAGAPRYGPNSAINADSESDGPENVEGRAGSGYAPQADNDNDSDDE